MAGLLTVVLLLGADPAPVDDVKPLAIGGLLMAAAAAGLTIAVPFADQAKTGTSDPALALAASAFFLVAVVRPFVFFGGQSKKPPKSSLADALRVLGSLTAVGGLASFITYGILRAGHSSAAYWALIPTAGLEAISAFSFSVDALLIPTVSAVPTSGGVSLAAGLAGRF